MHVNIVRTNAHYMNGAPHMGTANGAPHMGTVNAAPHMGAVIMQHHTWVSQIQLCSQEQHSNLKQLLA